MCTHRALLCSRTRCTMGHPTLCPSPATESSTISQPMPAAPSSQSTRIVDAGPHSAAVCVCEGRTSSHVWQHRILVEPRTMAVADRCASRHRVGMLPSTPCLDHGRHQPTVTPTCTPPVHVECLQPAVRPGGGVLGPARSTLTARGVFTAAPALTSCPLRCATTQSARVACHAAKRACKQFVWLPPPGCHPPQGEDCQSQVEKGATSKATKRCRHRRPTWLVDDAIVALSRSSAPLVFCTCSTAAKHRPQSQGSGRDQACGGWWGGLQHARHLAGGPQRVLPHPSQQYRGQ
jgi:hypothetical protein